MDRAYVTGIAGTEFSRLMQREAPEETTVFRRPQPRDEIDQTARQLVRRMMESGVIDPL